MARIGLPPGMCRTGRQAGRGRSPPSGREAGRPRRRRWRRAPCGHLGQADGAGQAASAASPWPRWRSRLRKVARLVSLPIRPRKREIAALQHLIADLEISGMAVGHHQKEAARAAPPQHHGGGRRSIRPRHWRADTAGNISARPSIQRIGKARAPAPAPAPVRHGRRRRGRGPGANRPFAPEDSMIRDRRDGREPRAPRSRQGPAADPSDRGWRLVRLDDDLVRGREARQQHAITGRLLPRRQPGECGGRQRLEEQA